ncbi:MAG: HD domain-containing phosphohydrolase [Halanaerobiales bacterium]
MDKYSDLKFLKIGIETSRIFSANKYDPDVYLKAGKYLFTQLEYLLDQIRIYTFDDNNECFREEIIYSIHGVKPGYDLIPFYQLPDEIKQKSVINTNTGNLLLLVPLVVKDKVIGLMEFKFKEYVNIELLNEVKGILIEMTEVIAVGLNQSILNFAKYRSVEFTDVLIELNNRFQYITNLDEMINEFLQLTISKFKFDRITIFMYDKDNEITSGRGISENSEIYEVIEIPTLPEPDGNYRYIEELPGYLFSLNTSTRKVGLVLFDNMYSLYDTSDHVVDIVRVICSQFASALDNIIMFDNLQKAACRDRLTGLYNRRFFQKAIAEYENPKHIPISVIIGDVNGLKITNDVFGHQAGDELLKKVASILEDCSRDRDIVFRWGGDEFFILLPDTVEEQVQDVYQNIKNTCDRVNNKLENINEVSVSISLGTATRTTASEELGDTLARAENRMYRNKLMESRSFRSSLISSLQATLNEKCKESTEHTDMMRELSEKMAAKMGLSESDRDNLKLLALLHDVGKVSQDNSILTKTGPLTEYEWDMVKRHPEAGYRIAHSTFELSSIAEYILYHHERWDGGGYPVGKKEYQIPLLSRIMAVIDAYTVMVQGAPYKRAISHQEALDELKRCSGSQFDPEVVEVFLSLDF